MNNSNAMNKALYSACEDILAMDKDEFAKELEKYKDGDISNFLKESGKFNDKDKRIEELENICGVAYQVVGSLALQAGVFETSEQVSKLLDNLSECRMIHTDVLPFKLSGE